MKMNTKFLALAFTGLGMLLGYAAASGKLNPFERANAAPPETASTPVVGDEPARCATPGAKAQLQALAVHNRKVEIKAAQNGKKPNICIIWGDAIGQSNISAYSHGAMGYTTPNIRSSRRSTTRASRRTRSSCTAPTTVPT